MTCEWTGCDTRLFKQDVMPHLQPLLENLFGAFKFPDSSENPYLMKCVMRVIEFIGADILPVAQICLQVGTDVTPQAKKLRECAADIGSEVTGSVSESTGACIQSLSL